MVSFPEASLIPGLIIVSAHYGLASAFTEKGFRLADGEEVVIDVTTPVQALVQDGHLVIPGGRGKVSFAYISNTH